MPVVTQVSTVGEQIKLRRPRSHLSQPISESDPNPSSIPSIIQSTRCKSTISSLLLSTFSNNTTSGANESLPSSIATNRKKNNFSSATFRGLGCTTAASQQVSVPAVIRTSADWQKKKTRKKKQKNSKNKTQGIIDGSHFQPNSNFNSASCLDAQDVWCGPGIGFSADAAASVDCVVARRHASARGKIDVEKMSQREVLAFPFLLNLFLSFFLLCRCVALKKSLVGYCSAFVSILWVKKHFGRLFYFGFCHIMGLYRTFSTSFFSAVGFF